MMCNALQMCGVCTYYTAQQFPHSSLISHIHKAANACCSFIKTSYKVWMHCQKTFASDRKLKSKGCKVSLVSQAITC